MISFKKIAGWLHQMQETRRRAKALRELEHMSQQSLNDIGMSRAALISITHGDRSGKCAAY